MIEALTTYASNHPLGVWILKREDCVQHEAGSVSASSLKINRLRDRWDLARHRLVFYQIRSGFHFPSPRNLSTASAIRFAVVVDCVIGNYSWPKRRTGENETLSSENDAPRKIARLLLSPSEQAQTEPVRLGT